MISLSIPWPPTVNTYWRHNRGRTHISHRGVAFRKNVCTVMMVNRIRPVTGKIALVINLYPPDKRRRDIDNVLKAVLDALQHGGLYGNDNQIKTLIVYMHDETLNIANISIFEQFEFAAQLEAMQ